MGHKEKKGRRGGDEVTRVGAVTITRNGRLTERQLTLTPEEHASIIAALPARREELRKSIDSAVSRATTVIARCDPLMLVLGLLWKNCLVDMENYAEPANEKSEAVVEYAHSLVAALKTYGTIKPSEEDTAIFETSCTEIVNAVTEYFISQPPDPTSDMATEETRFLGMMRHIHVRGTSMIEHETELLEALFAPHDLFFDKHNFPRTERFVVLCQAILDRLNTFVHQQVESVSQWAKHWNNFREATRDPRVDKAKALAAARAEIAADDTAKLSAINTDPLQAHVVPLVPDSAVFCRELTLTPGANEAFLTFKKSPGWPTNDTETTLRPLLAVHDVVYAMNPVALMRNRASILEAFIQRQDGKYFNTKFTDVRGRVIEELALKHFRAALPNSDIFSNVFYSMDVDGESRRYEADGIVVFDEFLFLLEMKSGPFSHAAMRGAPKRMAEDLGHLVAEPYEQALRTLKYLQSRASAPFENEKGKEVVRLDLSRFRRTYIVNVTLADIGHITARLNAAHAMGLVGNDMWPWSVHVNDLRVIAELVQSPAELLLYLDRRLALNDMKVVSTIDELDYFGVFLDNGLLLDPDVVARAGRFTPIGFRVPIDRYYDFVFKRVSSGPKPELSLSSWYRSLLAMVQAQTGKGATYAARTLLSLKGIDQEKIERWFEAKAESPLTLVAKSDEPIVVVSRKADVERDLMMHDLIFRTRHKMSGKPLVWVAIDDGFSSVVSCVLEGAVRGPEEGQLVQLNSYRRLRYESHVRRAGEPARSDSCPCGSGEMFKRCCLGRVASWNARKKK